MENSDYCFLPVTHRIFYSYEPRISRNMHEGIKKDIKAMMQNIHPPPSVILRQFYSLTDVNTRET